LFLAREVLPALECIAGGRSSLTVVSAGIHFKLHEAAGTWIACRVYASTLLSANG
jgi:hypothetical protein